VLDESLLCARLKQSWDGTFCVGRLAVEQFVGGLGLVEAKARDLFEFAFFAEFRTLAFG